MEALAAPLVPVSAGDAALDLDALASATAEAMFEEHGVNISDLSAPAIILAEAGGRMTDLRGVPSWAGPDALTSNGLLHDEVLEALSVA